MTNGGRPARAVHCDRRERRIWTIGTHLGGEPAFLRVAVLLSQRRFPVAELIEAAPAGVHKLTRCHRNVGIPYTAVQSLTGSTEDDIYSASCHRHTIHLQEGMKSCILNLSGSRNHEA